MTHILKQSEIKLVHVIAEQLIYNIKTNDNLIDYEVVSIVNAHSPSELLRIYDLECVIDFADHVKNAVLKILEGSVSENVILAEIARYNYYYCNNKNSPC